LLGKATKGIVNVAIDVAPVPDPRKYFPWVAKLLDRNGDGKHDLEDLKQTKWWEFLAGIVVMSLLLYFKVINLEVLKELVTFLYGLINKTQ
jgi:hypothetical protein